jgi:hypothetical protein
VRIPKRINTALDWVGDHLMAPLRALWQQLAIVAALLGVVALIATRGPSAGLTGLACLVCVLAGGWWPLMRVKALQVRNDALEREIGRLEHQNRALADRLETDQVLTTKMWTIPQDGGR